MTTVTEQPEAATKLRLAKIDEKIRVEAKRRTSRAARALKSGNYSYTNLTHLNVEITPSGTVYVRDDKTGQLRRVRGEAAVRIVEAVMQETAKAIEKAKEQQLLVKPAELAPTIAA